MAELSAIILNELIGIIYDAALDPGQWAVFVEKLSRWAGDAQIVLQGHDFVANRRLAEIAVGLPAEFARLYQEHFDTTNVWVPGIARMQIGKAGVPEAFVDRHSLFQTEYYNDFLRHMEVGTAAGIVLHRDSSQFLILSSNLRLKDEDKLRQPLLDSLDILAPHITRSFEMMRRLATDSGSWDYWRAAETSEHAVLLLDRRARVIHANTQARRLLGETALQTPGHPEAVKFRDGKAASALDRALDAISRHDLLRFQGEFVVQGHITQNLAASVVPLNGTRWNQGALFSQLFQDIPLALLVLQTRGPAANPIAVQFKLTPAELALIEALAQGQSLREYAERRQITVHTLRTQLKAVFAKTDMHRQSELIAMVMQGAPPDRR